MISKSKSLDEIEEELGYAPIESYATRLEWRDGRPVIVGAPISSNPVDMRLKDLMREAMNLPYDGLDPRYKGLTKGEALVIDLIDKASLGDKDARKEVLDRVLGRPVQNIKSLSVKGTLEQFLDQLEPLPNLQKVDTQTVPETPMDPMKEPMSPDEQAEDI